MFQRKVAGTWRSWCSLWVGHKLLPQYQSTAFHINYVYNAHVYQYEFILIFLYICEIGLLIVIHTTKISQLQAPKCNDDDYSIAKWKWRSMNIYFINEPCFNDFFLCDEAGLIIQVQFKIFGSIHRIQVLFIAEITYFYILSSSNYI